MIAMMIYAGVAVVVLGVAYIVLAAFATNRTVDHVFAEIKSFFFYNLIGVEGVMEDYLMRHRNKIGSITKTGKIAVITGGTKGIGYEVIKLLMQSDMLVVMGCRNVRKGENVGKQIRADGVTTGELQVFELDTSANASVRDFAANVHRHCTSVHYLINNAGIMFAPYAESVDGYESQFATNYLGHFLLTHLLLPLLVRGGTPQEHARIVNVASCVYTYGRYRFDDINHKKQYVSFEAYATSKLAQIHFSIHLDSVLRDRSDAHVQVHAVHPGVVNTDLFENSSLKLYANWFINLLFKRPIEGAYAVVYAAISPLVEGEGGTYITNCRIQELTSTARNPLMAEKIFNFTKDLLNIEVFGKDV